MDRWRCLLGGTLGLFFRFKCRICFRASPLRRTASRWLISSRSPRRSVKYRSYIRLTKLVTPTGSFAEHPPVSALLSAAMTRPRHGEASHSLRSISHVVHGNRTTTCKTWYNELMFRIVQPHKRVDMHASFRKEKKRVRILNWKLHKISIWHQLWPHTRCEGFKICFY